MFKLSIVIPVYNVAPWLERCLTSCLNLGLDLDEYEIVAVNDGSTDNSMDVLRDFVVKNEGKLPKLRILSQPNQGLSMARNAGLAAAEGEYVWWVDSDDFLVEQVGRKLMGRVENEHLDVLCFGLYLYDENLKGPALQTPYPIKDETEGAVVDGTAFLLKVAMPPAAWAAWYRREFLLEHDLKFMPGVYHEDQEFTPRAYLLAQKIAFDKTLAYNYVQREGSIMLSVNAKKGTDLLKVCQSLWEFTLSHTEEGSAIRLMLVNRVSFLFSQALSSFCRAGVKEFPGVPKELPFYPLSINKQLSKKERYKYRLINASVPLYMKLYHKFVGDGTPSVKKRLRTHC